MELLDPTVEQPVQAVSFSPRPQALAGKRVALIENTKYNSDKLLQRIGDILKKEHGVAEWKIFRKHNFAWGGNFLRPDGMHFEWVGERRDLVPTPTRYCSNVGVTGTESVAAGDSRAELFAEDNLAEHHDHDHG